MSKNKTSQYFAILFVHLCLRCDKVFKTAFYSLAVKTFAYHL